MPHAAFYVVQHIRGLPRGGHGCFNAARSILCGATVSEKNVDLIGEVSMPHAAFYVVQLKM